MITKDQWFKHPSFQTDLQRLLNDPVLQTAIQICRDQATFTPIPTNRAVDLLEFYAIMGAKKDGYNEFYINLTDLAQPKKADQPAQKAWEYQEEPEPKK